MLTHGNSELYRRLSEPWPTPEDANAAMHEFDAELAKLREKYRVPDLIVISEQHAIRLNDGHEVTALSVLRWGNAVEHETLVARALGRIQFDRQAAITEILREESLRTR